MHLSVLKKEIIEYLDPKPNENFIDATFGAGGHALAILEKNGPEGKVLGIEIDPELYQIFLDEGLSKVQRLTSDRLVLVNDTYVNLEKIVKEQDFKPINGILFDLGLSSWHFEESKRGFSFKRDERLDMRYNPERTPLTAFEIVNYWSKENIERILKELGEEEFAGIISKNLVKQRTVKPIRTTFDLVEIVKASVPSWYRKRRIHCATKTFQAMRIAVNEELKNLKIALSAAVRVLEERGRIGVISFHSLEDRIVKNFFKEKESGRTLQIITKKPITPSIEEIQFNPRSRSAKLRIAQKIT